MQSCSVKLVRNRLIYCTTFASTLHNDMLSIKQFMLIIKWLIFLTSQNLIQRIISVH